VGFAVNYRCAGNLERHFCSTQPYRGFILSDLRPYHVIYMSKYTAPEASNPKHWETINNESVHQTFIYFRRDERLLVFECKSPKSRGKWLVGWAHANRSLPTPTPLINIKLDPRGCRGTITTQSDTETHVKPLDLLPRPLEALLEEGQDHPNNAILSRRPRVRFSAS
jgi:hypothetical protein